MAAQSIEQFAASIRVPVDRLLRQLQEAGVGVRAAGDSISDEEKAEPEVNGHAQVEPEEKKEEGEGEG